MDIRQDFWPRLRRGLLLTAILAGPATSASAGLVVSIEPITVVTPGSTGNTLEVDLTNTGPGAVTIGGFAFELTADHSVLTFTGATTATTATYLFAGNSLYGPDITAGTSGSPPTIDANDNVLAPFSGTTIRPGETFGLGLVSFDIDSGVSAGPITILFSDSPGTSLSDPDANDVTIDVRNDGAVLISGGSIATPEPSSLLMGEAGIALGLAYTRRRRPRSQPTEARRRRP